MAKLGRLSDDEREVIVCRVGICDAPRALVAQSESAAFVDSISECCCCCVVFQLGGKLILQLNDGWLVVDWSYAYCERVLVGLVSISIAHLLKINILIRKKRNTDYTVCDFIRIS